MIRGRYWLVLTLLFLPVLLFGQESILRLHPYDGSAGSFINNQLAADTAANHGIPANRVYVLEQNGLYLANATFRVNAGQTLRMRADPALRPVIYLYPTGTGANPANPPGNFIDLRGDLYLTNLVISGYFEPVDTNINNLQGGLINVPTAGAGASIVIDGCILKSSNGNHIRTDGATRVVKMTNSIFADMGYLGRSNLGAGKGVDLRASSCDTMLVENCTFVNWQDRVLRHYNFSNPLAGTDPIRYLRFRHNTLVNGMSYHGLLSLGSMGSRAVITDNLFIDPFSLGNDTDATRQAEFVNSGETDPYGGARMNWIFTAPNDSTQWKISNNYYVISDSGQAFYNQFASAGVTGEGSPLTWHINSRLGADSVNAFKKISLVLNNTPALMMKMMRWYRDPNGGNKTKNTPGAVWNSSFDYDRRAWLYYDETLNCAYSTSSEAYTGAIGGYPAGDLNWFPTRYAQWRADPVSEVTVLPGSTPNSFMLNQNYPNPFNPGTKISFNLEKSGFATLTVYNVLGQKVATPIAGVLTAGSHDLNFDASNLPTGVYFYKLESGKQLAVKKMMLLK